MERRFYGIFGVEGVESVSTAAEAVAFRAVALVSRMNI